MSSSILNTFVVWDSEVAIVQRLAAMHQYKIDLDQLIWSLYERLPLTKLQKEVVYHGL